MSLGRGPSTEESPPFDRLLDLLADEQRRQVLHLLRDRGPLSVAELVSGLEAATGESEAESDLRTRLERDHLPKLAGAGLVTVDDTDRVAIDTLSPAALTVLDVDPGGRSVELPDPTTSVPPDNGEPHRSPIEQLQEQKRMFSTLVSNLPGMAYRCENERGWPMSFVSEGCRDLTGYDPGDIEQGDVSWGEDIIHPADVDRVWQTVQEAVQSREPFETTYRIRRADGTERWVWEQGRAVFAGDGVEALEGFVTDITERRRHERRMEAVFDGSFQFMGLLETDGTLLEANAAALEFGGFDREAVVGEYFWETPWWQIDESTALALREAVEDAAGGEFVRYEVDVQGDDRTATIDFSLHPVTNEAGEVTLLVAEGRDITERVRRERQLETLNEVSSRLLEAGSPVAVCEAAVDAAQQTLGLDLASIELFDEDSGKLTAAARTDAVVDLVGQKPLFRTDERESWEVFVEQEGTVYADVAEASGISPTKTPLDSAIVLPLGSHGVFIAGATDPEAFDDTDITLARTLATHSEVSLDSVVREAELRERSESLAEKNERLSHINALNDVIRELLRSLIGASSREEIVRTASESLGATGPYRFAWIGSLDPVDGEIRPEARAGIDEGYLDAVTVSEGDKEPTARAVETESVVVVDRIRSDPPFEPWEKAALDREYRSAVAVPLAYDDAHHGVLTVYAGEADRFDDLERSVLSELGEAIGYAITAAQRKQALLGGQVVELEFSLQTPETPLLRSVRDAGGEFTFEGAFQEDEGEFSVFFSVTGADPSDLRAACEREPDIADLRVVAERDEGTLYECVLLGEEGLLATVFSHGGVPRDLTTDGGTATLVVDLPESRDVRAFTETIEERFPSASLLARRQRDRQLQTVGGFRQRLHERLTERNLEVVKQAYYSGFFEWPRENSGEEVASSLEISQPTFNRHLRNAQQALFELLLEGGE